MVNLRNVFILLVILLLTSSCCDLRSTSERGMRSKHSYKKYLNKRINPAIVGIDTAVLYKSIGYMHKESNNNIIEPVTDPIALNKTSYYKFYSNGNIYLFRKHDSVPLSKNLINPKKGDINFLIKKRDSYVIMKYSTIECGTFVKKKFLVKGDTLIISAASKEGYRIWYYYKKQQIPKDWLTFSSNEAY